MEKKNKSFSAIEAANIRQLVDALNAEDITKDDIVHVFLTKRDTIVVLFYK